MYFDRIKDTIICQNEFVTTELDTLNTAHFPYADRLQYRDIFSDKANNLDTAFWNGYTILKENSFIEHLQNRELNAKSLSLDYMKPKKNLQKGKIGVVKIIKRFSYDLSAVTVLPTYRSSAVSLIGSGFTVSSATAQPPSVVFGLSSSFNVKLSNRFGISLGGFDLIGKLKLENYLLNLDYKCQTTINTRPLKFITGLGVSSNSLYLPIGLIDGSQSINGKKLNGKIEVNMQKLFYALQPNFKIALELSNSWDVFVTANYLIDFSSSNRILFKEQEGFFLSRSSTYLKTSDTNIDFRVNGTKTNLIPISINPLFVQFGLNYRFVR